MYQASKRLDLTLPEWKMLLLDQSAKISVWMYASHLVKSLEKPKENILSLPAQTNGEVFNLEELFCFSYRMQPLLLDYYAISPR